jgi:hypothetical protein
MVFENRVLRRIYGSKRDEVTRRYRRLHNDDLNDLYFSPNIIRWAGHVALCRRVTHRFVVGKLEG